MPHKLVYIIPDSIEFVEFLYGSILCNDRCGLWVQSVRTLWRSHCTTFRTRTNLYSKTKKGLSLLALLEDLISSQQKCQQKCFNFGIFLNITNHLQWLLKIVRKATTDTLDSSHERFARPCDRHWLMNIPVGLIVIGCVDPTWKSWTDKWRGALPDGPCLRWRAN